MINLDTLSRLAKRYERHNCELNELKKQIEDFKEENKEQLEILLEEKSKLEDLDERATFTLKNQLLNEYEDYLWQNREKEKLILRMLYGVNEEEENDEHIRVNGMPYILLKHLEDESYDIVNLREYEIIKLDELTEIERVFLVRLLKYQDALIGTATRDDIPLLMNIIEDVNFEEKVGSLRMIKKCADSKRQFERAKLFDEYKHTSGNVVKAVITNPITNDQEEVEYKLPFIYDSLEIEKMWYRFDEIKATLSEDDYWTLYYKYVMLFANDIESAYEDAPEELKEIVLDVYCKFEEEDKEFGRYIQFRTASPLINEEVLKRKHVKSKIN